MLPTAASPSSDYLLPLPQALFWGEAARLEGGSVVQGTYVNTLSQSLSTYLRLMERLNMLERYVHELPVDCVFQRDTLLIQVVDRTEIGFDPRNGVESDRLAF